MRGSAGRGYAPRCAFWKNWRDNNEWVHHSAPLVTQTDSLLKGKEVICAYANYSEIPVSPKIHVRSNEEVNDERR